MWVLIDVPHLIFLWGDAGIYHTFAPLGWFARLVWRLHHPGDHRITQPCICFKESWNVSNLSALGVYSLSGVFLEGCRCCLTGARHLTSTQLAASIGFSLTYWLTVSLLSIVLLEATNTSIPGNSSSAFLTLLLATVSCTPLHLETSHSMFTVAMIAILGFVMRLINQKDNWYLVIKRSRIYRQSMRECSCRSLSTLSMTKHVIIPN